MKTAVRKTAHRAAYEVISVSVADERFFVRIEEVNIKHWSCPPELQQESSCASSISLSQGELQRLRDEIDAALEGKACDD